MVSIGHGHFYPQIPPMANYCALSDDTSPVFSIECCLSGTNISPIFIKRQKTMSVTGSRTLLSQTSRANDTQLFTVTDGAISGAEGAKHAHPPSKSTPYTSVATPGGEWNATSEDYPAHD